MGPLSIRDSQDRYTGPMRPTLTPAAPAVPAHLVVLALTDPALALLRDVLAHELGDDHGFADDVAAVVGRLEAALESAVPVPPVSVSLLPEQGLLHLPNAGRWVSGPGCAAAAQARADAARHGRSTRATWDAALDAVAVLLAQAVIDGHLTARAHALGRLLVAVRHERDHATR